MRVPLPLTLFAVMALAACGAAPVSTTGPTGTGTATQTPGATTTAGGGGGNVANPDSVSCNNGVVGTDVSIVDFGYEPQAVTADTDETVHWANIGATDHTVTFDNGKDCGTMAPGDSLTVLFLEAGTYPYHCEIHATMTGTVTVN